MARSPPVVLILGHSFVRRLCHDLETGFDQRADLNFNLKGTAVVFMHGVGGRTVPKLRMFDVHVVKQLSPDIIIVEIGTNVIPRVFSCAASQTSFLTSATALNQYTNAVLGDLPNVFCWVHTPFSSPGKDFYLNDGVHLNSVGQYQLYRSYRGAILRAIRML